jgi:hypothetical protein
MSAIPGAVETDTQPPMTIPLGHFVVALLLLVAGTLAVVAGSVGRLPGFVRAVPAHLLLAGFVCVTISGALTQFVPVWSGVELHSRRLARWQLRLLVAGLLGLVAGLLVVEPTFVVGGGLVLLAGFWLVVWNVGRTLWTARPWDVTERHFAQTLGYVVVVTALGATLAVGLVAPVTPILPERLGISRPALVATHATLAVFGIVLTTMFGALYQLATMFTQTDLSRSDRWLQRVERHAYPVGVVALAVGRLLGHATLARLGGLLVVVVGIVSVLLIVGHRLVDSVVELSPMLRRYAVAVVAGLYWAAATVPAWIADPLARDATLGAPVAVPTLLGGVIGLVVVGTLYHVVPFVVWVHEYSDLLGFEPVPSIGDLFDGRLAVIDLLASVVGVAVLAVAGHLGWPTRLVLVGACSLALAATVASVNLVGVVVRHSPLSLPRLFVGAGVGE